VSVKQSLKYIQLSGIFLSALIIVMTALPGSGFCNSSPAANSSKIDDADDFFQESDAGKSIKDADSQDDFFSDDSENSVIDAGQDTNDIKTITDSSLSPWRFSGHLKSGAEYRFAHERPLPGRTDHRGLSSLYGSIDLELDYKFSSSWSAVVSAEAFYDAACSIQGRDKYPSGFLDRYEKDIKINKAFIQGVVNDNLDIKIGRQIVVWGKSDNIRITDVLNPLNSLKPGLTDLEDLRIPVFISRFDYYINSWAVSAFFVHEHRGSLTPVFGSDFFPLPFAVSRVATPSFALNNTGAAVSITKSRFLPGMDIAFYAARIYDKNPSLYMESIKGIPVPVFKYARINMAGAAVNKAAGNFLLKTETAFFDGLKLSNLENSYSRVDILGGLEYSGFKNTQISFEAADRFYTDLDRAARDIKTRKHNIQYAFRVSRTFMNEILNLSLLASYFGEKADQGGFLRLKAEYDLTDSVKLSGGVIFYESGGTGELKNIGDNDMVFASFKYSF